MKTIKYKISGMILLLAIVTGVYGQESVRKEGDSRKYAKKLWELAIRAQGGRERLYSVQNMVVISRSKVRYSIFKTYDHVLESLFVFPSKWWELDDNGPSVLGITMKMENFETRQMYIADRGQKIADLKPISDQRLKEAIDKDGNVRWTGLCDYLLETKWWRPVPQSATSGKVGGEKVDIIQTMLNGKRIDFYFNETTHLPIRNVTYNYYPSRKDVQGDITNLADYVEINGLMMPSKRTDPAEGIFETLAYKINVEYDENIFVRPLPTADLASGSWKKK